MRQSEEQDSESPKYRLLVVVAEEKTARELYRLDIPAWEQLIPEGATVPTVDTIIRRLQSV